MNENYIDKLPMCYRENILNTVINGKCIFGSNLITIILGGSCGKNNPITEWSDIDLYIVLKEYKEFQIKAFINKINKASVHIGVTFYTLLEIKNNFIDGKTKIMLYEKQKFKVNPTLYGFCPFKKINYKEIILNDLYKLPNIIHEFRRLYIGVLIKKSNVDKVYIKKMLILIKCYLNINGIFVYGYEKTVLEFLKVCNKKTNSSTKPYTFDIMDSLIYTDDSVKKVLCFSKVVLEFIIVEMEKLKYGKKN
jgi:predicted nucleotidyltransferase